MNFDRESTTVKSALWSAYGDALGFITELANNRKTIVTRSGNEFIGAAIPWRRHIGGIYGPKVDLPSGCYSDDTQLRLSTSRCINNDGFFDVEVFSKFELPIWQNYALGGGRATKIAAQTLTQKNKNWFSNFFNKGNVSYINAGGNGAVMRIQPHVWAATDLDELNCFIPDVIRNTVVTHGHLRAIVGAVYHAICLSQLLNGRAFSYSLLKENALICSQLPYFIEQDDFLSNFWVHEWEENSKSNFENEVQTVVEELLNDIDLCSKWLESKELNYRELVSTLCLDTPEQRGSGLKTPLIASLLILKIDRVPLNDILFNIVNELDTDTDTIATVFASMGGMLVDYLPQETVLDQEYIKKEAIRLFGVSQGQNIGDCFVYPDLSKWQPSKVVLDFVGKNESGIFLSGFGELRQQSTEFIDVRKGHVYQWCSTSEGFSVLVKRRHVDDLLFSKENNFASSIGSDEHYSRSENNIQQKLSFERNPTYMESDVKALVRSLDMDSLTKYVISNNFDAKLIGDIILELCSRNQYAIEMVTSFSSIIAKAKVSRDKKLNG